MKPRTTNTCVHEHNRHFQITVIGSTTSPANGLVLPLQGHATFPPKGGLTNHVHYITGGRLKAASLVLVFTTLFLNGRSHTAHRYTFLSLPHLHYRWSRNNTLSPKSGGHIGLCTLDAHRKASGCFYP